MKEEKRKIIGVVLILCGIVLLIYFNKSIFNNRKNHISKYLDININNCRVEKQIDTHGGFLGDGDYYSKLICTEKEDSEIKSKWLVLPLLEEIKKALDIKQCDNDDCKNVLERYNIPNVINGYYYFYDRHHESKDNKNAEELNNRSSYNFSLGIYDSDTRTIYYYELDT